MLNSNLKAFVRVAECGSFTKAAESLYLSPTAVMKQINALEKHLDLILLERSPWQYFEPDGRKSLREIERRGLHAQSGKAFHGAMVSGQPGISQL